jgi:hypothetical protein
MNNEIIEKSSLLLKMTKKEISEILQRSYSQIKGLKSNDKAAVLNANDFSALSRCGLIITFKAGEVEVRLAEPAEGGH